MHRIIIGLVILACMPHTAMADWQLDSTESELFFSSVKKGSVAEVHHFNSLSGGISDAGNAKVVIDLTSVDTSIPIRNDRMQTQLFETQTFPSANVTADIDLAAITALKVGEVQQLSLALSLDLHGVTKKIDVALSVTKLTQGRLLVSGRAPIMLKASDFGLEEGVAKLQALAKLPSISPIVPVTFQLVFKGQ